MELNSMRGERGFTLTELLVVLLLIGIFTGVMLAEMRGTFQDALLRSSAREVMSGLSLASSRAVTLNQPHAFEFDRTENKFRIISRSKARADSDDTDHGEERKIDERITVEILKSDALAEALPDEREPEAQLHPDVIQFYPDGTADAREIILRDKTKAELVLRISPVTARVRVEEDRPL